MKILTEDNELVENRGQAPRQFWCYYCCNRATTFLVGDSMLLPVCPKCHQHYAVHEISHNDPDILVDFGQTLCYPIDMGENNNIVGRLL
jgi:hypothetical protein